MRRLISYSILSGALLLGIGITSSQFIQKVNTDIAYSDGKTLYFRASHEDPESVTGNYGDENGEFLLDSDVDTRGNRIIDDIADTLKTRLDSWTSSEYKLQVVGTDTIAVTLRTSRNNDLQYNYLERYLTFSGKDFELDAENINYADYPASDYWRDIIDGSEARIENYTLSTGVELPTVVIPLKEGQEYQTAFRDLLTYCTDNTKEAQTDEEGNETSPATQCRIVIWANRKEADLYSNQGSDPNVASRILTTVSPATAKYIPSSDEEKEEAEQTLSLRLVPESSAFEGGQYNPEKGAYAYEAANFYLHMLNASKLSYETSGEAESNYTLTYLYSEKASASVENLVKLGDWFATPALGRTLIATLIGIVLLAVGLIAFQRLSALAGLVASLGTGFLSFITFFAFGSQFNIAALVGLIACTLLGLLGYLYHVTRVKIELYRGRTLKKANAEAAKKAVWPIVDAGIVAFLIGVFLYAFGGAVASKAGVMVAIGGVVSILVNLIVTRFLMWELANDDTAASAFPSYYRVNKDKIPDPLKDEKQSYFGTFADSNFKKNRKFGLIGLCILLLAGVGSTVAWGVASGNVYNDLTSGSSTSLIQLDIRSNESGRITGTTAERLYSESELTKTDINGNLHVFEAIKVEYKDTSKGNLGNKTLSSYITEIRLSDTCKTVYHTPDAGTGISDYWFYYTISLSKEFSTEDGVYTFSMWNGSFDGEGNPVYETSVEENFGNALNNLINSRYVTDENDFRVSFDNYKSDATQPYFWQIAMGVGIGLAAVTLYLMLRFRPGKGLALGLSATVVGFVSIAFFSLTRIPVYPVVSLGAVIATLATLLFGLYILNSDKEIAKESKEKEKGTFEFRSNSLDTAIRYDAGNALYFAMIAAYVCIVFFGFGPIAYGTAFASALLGVLVGSIFLLMGYSGLAEMLMKLFGLIRIRAPKKKKKKKVTGQLMKKKGAEPEESIFIGIND